MNNRGKDIFFYTFDKDHDNFPFHVWNIEEIRAELNNEPVFREAYVTTYLFSEGDEELSVNGCRHKVGPREVVTTLPGEIWKWNGDTHTQGFCVIFAKDFLLQHFHNEGFLRQFSFLDSRRPSPFMRLEQDLYTRIRTLVQTMHEDMRSAMPLDDKRHLLRAQLYQFLMLLKGGEMIVGLKNPLPKHGPHLHADFFTDLVERYFRTEHRIAFYASRMALTPNHLNKIIHAVLGKSPKAFINDRLILEATQLLIYTSLTVKEIAHKIGFEDESYFVRFFTKNMGTAPTRFREQSANKLM